MNWRETATWVLVSISVVCALIVTSIVVKQEMLGTNERSRVQEATPVVVQDWARFAQVGHRMGPANAPVTILEFADFECPVCRNFTIGALRYVRNKYPNQVAVVFRHWPLSYHHLAYPAARAAECAADQGRFQAFHDLLFSQQDSLGLKTFDSYARESGVTDSTRFMACIHSLDPVEAIEQGRRDAAEIGGTGTPTIVINGIRLGGAPDSARLAQIVSKVLAGAR